jgi:DNA helicase-2/ATP-dependent DNA helicase PcrA
VGVGRGLGWDLLKRGYRSTKPILEYANRLLPRAERALLAFQTEGSAPNVDRVPFAFLGRSVVIEVIRLLDAYPAGTVSRGSGSSRPTV